LFTRLLAESDLKRKTLLLALLMMSAGVLSVLISTTPLVRAQGGSVEGKVYWIDQYGDAHPMAWARVTADDGASPSLVAYTTTDGSYMMWLPTGTYTITVLSSPGFYPESAPNIVVSSGSSTSVDFTLKPTGKPIPELLPCTQPIIILGMLMITAVAVRRHKTRARN
jgi:hypothetical protein